MIDLNNNFKKKVFGVTLAVMAIAFVVSTGSRVLAQTSDSTKLVMNKDSVATVKADSNKASAQKNSEQMLCLSQPKHLLRKILPAVLRE